MANYYKVFTIRKLNDVLLGVTDYKKLIAKFDHPMRVYDWIEWLDGNRFRARIKIGGERVALGIYDSFEEAESVVDRELTILVREMRRRQKLIKPPKKIRPELSFLDIEKALAGRSEFKKMLDHHQTDLIQTNATTDIKGVRFSAASGKYTTSIMLAGRGFHLGVFPSKEEAAVIVKRARQKVIKILLRKARAAGEI